jgi:formate dehydrogenase subunit gamma
MTSAKSDTEAIQAICVAHGSRPDALLEILHDIQHSQGFIAEWTLPVIAKALNLSRAEVHGVVSFYHDFRREPPGRHVVKICRAESCQAMGARDLCDHAERRLGTAFGSTTPDREFTLDAVYCLGNCALSPAIMIDGSVHGRVSANLLDRLLDDALGSPKP